MDFTENGYLFMRKEDGEIEPLSIGEVGELRA